MMAQSVAEEVEALLNRSSAGQSLAGEVEVLLAAPPDQPQAGVEIPDLANEPYDLSPLYRPDRRRQVALAAESQAEQAFAREPHPRDEFGRVVLTEEQSVRSLANEYERYASRFEGPRRRPHEVVPFVRSAVSAGESLQLARAKRAMAEGRATLGDVQRIARTAVEADRRSEQGVWGQAWDIVRTLPATGIEFGLAAIPAGAFTAAKAGVVAAKAIPAAGKLGKAAIGAIKGIAGLGGAVASQPQLVAEFAARRMADQYQLEQDDETKLVRMVKSDDQAWSSPFAAGTLEAAIEVGTELSGGLITKIPFLRAFKAQVINRLLGRSIGRSVSKIANLMSTKAGIQNAAVEFLEERGGDAARWALGLQKNLTPTAKQAAAEALAFLVIPAGQVAAGTVTAGTRPLKERLAAWRQGFGAREDILTPEAAAELVQRDPGEAQRLATGPASRDAFGPLSARLHTKADREAFQALVQEALDNASQAPSVREEGEGQGFGREPLGGVQRRDVQEEWQVQEGQEQGRVQEEGLLAESEPSAAAPERSPAPSAAVVEPPAAPPTETASEAAPAGFPETLSPRQVDIEAVRNQMRLGTIDSPARTSWEDDQQQAIAQGLHERDAAIDLSLNVLGLEPKKLSEQAIHQTRAAVRAMTAVESAGATTALGLMVNRHESIMRQIDEAQNDPAFLATLGTQAERLEQDIDLVTVTIHRSGSERGRQLAAQKFTIDRDMRLAPVLARARSRLAKSGKQMIPALRSQFEDMTRRLAEKEAEVAKWQAANNRLTAEAAIKRPGAARRRQGKRPKLSRAELTAKVKTLLEQGCL